MARRLVAPRSAGKKIDFKQWFAIPSVFLQASADATLQGGAIVFSSPATILRTRGRILCAFDETKQVGDQADVVVGLAVTSTDAFNAGAGSMPDPAGDVDFPWVFWTQLHLEAYVAAGEESFGASVREIMVDTKAMRKMKPQENMSWVVQLANLVGAPTVQVHISQTRVLIGT